MVNIRQLTNFDIASTASRETKSIDKAGVITDYDYYVITSEMLGGALTKMGYCCEVKGIPYPIYLTINNNETEFQIGKTGIFEFQEELFKNDEEEKEIQVFCTEVKVPVDIIFTLDYCY